MVHGTDNAYIYHKCRCEACRLAHNNINQARREANQVRRAPYMSYWNRVNLVASNDVPGLQYILQEACNDPEITPAMLKELIDLAAWKGWNNDFKPEIIDWAEDPKEWAGLNMY